MSLPDSWVKSLFARFQVRYGTAWTRMWEGIDMAAVRQDWAAELGGFVNRPDALAYGLENLPPDRPPTVQQFRAICNKVPEPAPKALPAPEASAEVVAAVREAIKPSNNSPLAWANRLRAREVACEPLTPAQRQAWRDVLGN